MTTELEFLDERHADLSPLEQALRLDAAADAKADAADRQESAQRAAAAQERVELLQLANRQGHDPIGELRRSRAAAVAAQDEVVDLTAKLEKASRRRDRINENLTALTRQMDQINAAVASRSAVGIDDQDDLLAPARRAHAAFVEETRLRMAGAAAGRAPRARRPFVSRGSVIGRSEHCLHCIDQGVDDETSYLLHSDPEFGIPVTPPATQAAQTAADRQRAEAERLRALGYSEEISNYAAVPAGRVIAR